MNVQKYNKIGMFLIFVFIITFIFLLTSNKRFSFSLQTLLD